jgi:Sugar (pentulose and hexulose) kinases
VTRLVEEPQAEEADAIRAGDTILGIELGSTRIKAQLIDRNHRPIAAGAFEWSSRFVDGNWTYPLDAVWGGLQACYADLVADVERRFSVTPSRYAAIGVSGMMHGYLAFDAEGALLTPFRTWRNTTAEAASVELTSLFKRHIPQRWSISHLYQAVLNDEPHVENIDFLTTLAGYVHWRLTGLKVLGAGDASGMFPIDPASHDWDSAKVAVFDQLVAPTHPHLHLDGILPQPLLAGQPAGNLTVEGAGLLDPTGTLEPGIPLCPPEGDAGTGMVATNSVAARTGNISVGTSIFAMVVLERPLSTPHREIDLVVTPSGDPVAMVHCNNGANELAEWASVFTRFSAAAHQSTNRDEVFAILLKEALAGQPDGGGLLAYNFITGEPIAGVTDGRPMLLRTPGSQLTLANLMRVQVYSMFGALSLGLQILASEGVAIDAMYAHGGVFKTEGVAQRLLAAAIGAPVSVSETASEGGSWGMAVLAAYHLAVREGSTLPLTDYLATRVLADSQVIVLSPDPDDVAGYSRFLDRYRKGLAVEQSARIII